MVTVGVAFLIAEIVDRGFIVRGNRLTTGAVGAEVNPVTATRVRLIRRLVFAMILLIGVAIALSQFEGVKRLANGVLASSAVLGLVVGFAARQTLANGVAGVLLAITQPIRIGDLVTFENETGTVEDVRLTYTYINTGDGRRVIVPNERLASSTIQNHTIVDPCVNVEVSVWLAPGADATRALDVLAAPEGREAIVADVEREGIRIAVSTWVDTSAERAPTAARLRAESLERLRSEGLSSVVDQ